MSDFSFIHNPYSQQWSILAPRRAKRPGEEKNPLTTCPFCSGGEGDQQELFRLPPIPGQSSSLAKSVGWQVRILLNKFPFAKIHEIIVHSPDHHKNIEELPLYAVKAILDVFQQRYRLYKEKGNIIIFHNFGKDAGASLPHPHSQLVVVPKEIDIDVPLLTFPEEETITTQYFTIFCPTSSQWPDEVWIAPKKQGISFDILGEEVVHDLAFSLKRIIELLAFRHGNDFPFNFYISPWKQWYIRIIPRLKKIGGFELATNIFVNTQDPHLTTQFLQQHFHSPDFEKIKKEHMAEYSKGV